VHRFVMDVHRRGFLFLLCTTLVLASAWLQSAVRGQTAGPGDKPSGESKEGPTTKKAGSDDKGGKKEHLKPFPVGPREAGFKEMLGDGYQVRRTDHFFVIYDAPEDVVKDFISRLERTYEAVHRFASQLDIKIKYPKEKLPVVFCRDFDEYDRRCKQIVGRGVPPEAAGLYWREPLNFSIFYDMSQAKFVKEHADRAMQLKEEARTSKDQEDRKKKSREAEFILNRIDVFQQNQNRSVVQHEVAHQLLFNFRVHKPGAANPQWFVEGLATQFESPPGKMGAGFNVVNQRRLQVLREKFKKESPELRDFVGDPSKGGQLLSEDGYAIAWGMVHYLIKQKNKELPKYVEMLKQRMPGQSVAPAEDIADFEECFGKIDDKFKKKWLTFIKGLPYRPTK
jgi:hypothetical protein